MSEAPAPILPTCARISIVIGFVVALLLAIGFGLAGLHRWLS